MKYFFTIIAVFLLFACNSKKQESNKPEEERKLISRKQAYLMAFDMTDLSIYSDKSKFIARFVITKKYNNTIIVELDSLQNGCNLSVKQEVGDFNPNNFDKERSLSFNQLNYHFDNNKFSLLKNGFLSYKTDSTTKDIKCPGCLDPETWTIEIYDYGKFSSLTKDYQNDKDTAFINDLLRSVNLNKSNRYTITY
jgi:hypothetical protein